MPRFEYKVVPAPTKGLKGKGIKGPEARFSHAIQELMNGLSGYGWEYLRAETLPSVERSGLTGSTTEWRNVLVFRRLREDGAEAFHPELLPAPEEDQEIAVDDGKQKEIQESEPGKIATEEPANGDAEDQQEVSDNGVEDTSTMSRVSGALSTLAMKRKGSKAKS